MWKRVCVGLLCLSCEALCNQGRNYGRSVVATPAGVVATSQVAASQAGAQILARGGSAVDAAIAANAVLAVTEPMMNGPGGDLFALYWDAKTGRLQGLNASGPAPRALTPEFLAKAGHKEMPKDGIHSVTVPGAVDGWSKLHARYGKLPWKDLFQYAIAYAEEGFPVGESIQFFWTETEAVDKLRKSKESARVFLPSGKPPDAGTMYCNPGLARAFRILAEKGTESFYKGKIAEAILATSRELGGTLAAEDLVSFSSEWVDPISAEYRGWRVYELPPNGQGMAALEMLNIMEALPTAPEGHDSAAEIHRRIESMKLAYSDLKRFNGDPKYSDIPVNALISDQYARERAKLIDARKANCEVAAGVPLSGDTVYLAVADREGNTISLIQSISATFGSGVAVSGMGFLLHNRGSLFTLEPKHPNVLAGGKRPFHTIIPAFMRKGD
ncbi:MAG: gamma-glutamyltransferase family protein, partial [Bryobacteraceae bacterium]